MQVPTATHDSRQWPILDRVNDEELQWGLGPGLLLLCSSDDLS